MNQKVKLFFVLFVLLFISLPVSSKELKVGTYYFPGWFNDPNHPHWHQDGIDLKSFKETEPIDGWEDLTTEKYMQKEIKWASSYGVDFFCFDWYWNFSNKTEGGLDYAIKNFKKVNKSNMKFSLMWANVYGKESSKDIKDYYYIIDYWKKNYFTDKSYLKTPDGKPIVYIFFPVQMEMDMGLEGVKLFVNKLKKETNAFVIYVDNEHFYNFDRATSYKYDAIAGWNNLIHHTRNQKTNISSYSSYKLSMKHLLNGVFSHKTNLPIYPSIIPGWDERPWRKKPGHVLLKNNPEDFGELLQFSKNSLKLKNYPFDMIMIESWNEFGEGAYLIPTKKWKYKFLEQVQKLKAKK